RPTGGHADRAVAADAVDRDAARSVVLVASGRLPSRRLSVPATATSASNQRRAGYSCPVGTELALLGLRTGYAEGVTEFPLAHVSLMDGWLPLLVQALTVAVVVAAMIGALPRRWWFRRTPALVVTGAAIALTTQWYFG